MKIRCIHPSRVADAESRKAIYPRNLWYPSLAFPILAVHTPVDVEMEIIDETIEDLNFDDPVDLVAITAMTPTVGRAYEIAHRYRERGVKTVMGGFHASALPDEAGRHVDCVAVGEGELVWPQIIEDFKNGQLKPRYTAGSLFDMTRYKPPRVELLSKYWKPADQYEPPYYPSLNVIEVSRGCPFKCSFCAVSNFYGEKHRYRPVEDVLDGIRRRKLESRDRVISFSDDNLYGNKPYFKKLLSGLKKLNITWTSMISINVAHSPEILQMMADSGCQAIGLGIESLDQECLKSVNKSNNKVEDYDRLFKLIDAHHIKIYLAMMVGFDHDDETVFEKIHDWLKNRMEYIVYCNCHILTPFPGTILHRQVSKENRITDFDWDHYDCRHVVYEPRQMSADTLLKGFVWLRSNLEAMSIERWKELHLK
ncbi:MAG: radical SAM protein [Candidatus Aminicenantes bacterium]|nr:radical SAM protein [Candidatus Aminicenantes bacterium]